MVCSTFSKQIFYFSVQESHKDKRRVTAITECRPNWVYYFYTNEWEHYDYMDWTETVIARKQTVYFSVEPGLCLGSVGGVLARAPSRTELMCRSMCS